MATGPQPRHTRYKRGQGSPPHTRRNERNRRTMAETTLRVLLVEDDENDYLLVRDYLREANGVPFSLEWAASYEAGLAALTRQAYDVALIDDRLGARNGLDLLLVHGRGSLYRDMVG